MSQCNPNGVFDSAFASLCRTYLDTCSIVLICSRFYDSMTLLCVRFDSNTLTMSFVLRLPRKMHLCRSSSKVPRLPSFLEMLQNPHVLLILDKINNPLHLPSGTTSERPKVARTCGVFNILTSKCASRHNGVHFFDISTSKSGPTLVCFAHFDLECASHNNGVHFFDISTSKSGPTLGCFCTF